MVFGLSWDVEQMYRAYLQYQARGKGIMKRKYDIKIPVQVQKHLQLLSPEGALRFGAKGSRSSIVRTGGLIGLIGRRSDT